jgi:AraC-like DNA-binding protein
VITIAAGQIGLFWASIPHQGIKVPETAGVWATLPLPLILSWKLPGKLDQRLLKGEFVVTGSRGDALLSDRFMFKRWVDDYQHTGAADRRTLLLEIEARFRRLAAQSAAAPQASSQPPEPGIESALAFLHQHYSEDVHVAQVARAAGWNEKYLMRAFKRALAMSVGEYLMRLRISHAQWLLATTDLSALDVAYDSGFQSLAPFYQAFRRVTGARPLQFRRNAQSAPDVTRILSAQPTRSR